MERILVIGASGQIGCELVPELRQRYGVECVVAGCHQQSLPQDWAESGPSCALDCMDRENLSLVIKRFNIGIIFHLAACLSASGEADPFATWQLNMGSLLNVLELACEHRCRVFFPSSIAAFGDSSPKESTPQVTIQRPSSMYGISKVAGELLGDYVHARFGLDCRGLRYPGIISHKKLPGGGTTDYAVEMFHAAVKGKEFFCCLAPHTTLDMMYMPDAVRAAIELMEADADKLAHRNAYNVTGFNINPVQLYLAIKEQYPSFSQEYRVDPLRQRIAESWPDSLDDHLARLEWGWRPRFGLEDTVTDMLDQLKRAGDKG